MYIQVPTGGLGCLCGTLGTDAVSSASVLSLSTVTRVALAMAVGAIVWKLFTSSAHEGMRRNMMAPWADIGPLFAKGFTLGPAFALTHFV